MKTIKQIAGEIGVSKQAVQKRIAREPLHTKLAPYISIHGDTKYINELGESLIKTAFLARNKGEGMGMDIPTNKGIDTIDTLISMLQLELEAKNKQIEDLTAALLAAQQNAAAAQALHAGTMQNQMIDTEESNQTMGKQKKRKKEGKKKSG